MEEIKISKEKLVKIRDIIIFSLLFFWMIMPIIQCLKPIYTIVKLNKMYFGLMKTIGIVGIGLSAITIFDRIKNAENKKSAIKELLPIFIFVLYMIWTLIACFNSRYQRTAFHGNVYRQEGYYMYLNYAGYFLCAFLLKNEKLRKILFNTFIISSLFLVIMSRATLSGERLENIFINADADVTIFAQFNHYGYYLMMTSICSLGLFIKEKNKIVKVLYLITFTIISYGLIWNNTFGCFLAASTTLILYAIYSLIKKTDRECIFTAITIFIILSCFITRDGVNIAHQNLKKFTHDVTVVVCKITGIEMEGVKGEILEQEFEKAGTTRMRLWKYGIQFMLDKPLLGYGPDNLGPLYEDVYIHQDRPHNLLIQLATTSGIPAMLLYVTAVGIIVVIGIVKLCKDEKGKIVLLIVTTYLISAMFGNSMYYTSPYFFIALGSLMHSNLEKKEE